MIYTEDEAKTKECRAIPPTVDPIRLRPAIDKDLAREPWPTVPAMKCSGSACMLWETTETLFEDYVIAEADVLPPRPGPGWRLRAPNGRMMWSKPIGIAGYCGLLKK